MAITPRRQPDYRQFVDALTRKEKPSRLSFYEHVAGAKFVAERTGTEYDKISPDDARYWEILVDFYLGMGYDVIPMQIGLNCPLPITNVYASEQTEAHVVFRNMEDFESYSWTDESLPINFGYFETVAGMLPDGAKICAGVGGGIYEWASMMLGTIGLSYALVDNPELVSAVFEKIGKLQLSAYRQLAQVEAVCSLRHGDDLGFKTATFLSPDCLRRYVFPIYKALVQEAHANDKPFLLHSCGNLQEVYDELIEDCGIDGKHSFEETIMPVGEFKKIYGDRVTPVGGLDVDFICRRSIDDIRAYARRTIEECFCDGYYILGTGNSVTDYMPVENYMAVIEEGLKMSC